MENDQKARAVLNFFKVPFYEWRLYRDIGDRTELLVEFIVPHDLKGAFLSTQKFLENLQDDHYDFMYSELFGFESDLEDFKVNIRGEYFWIPDELDIFSSKHLPKLLKEAGVQTVPVEALDDVLDFTYNFINLTNQKP
jgi:hypothetical protein